MGERFYIEVIDDINKPADIQALVNKALDCESDRRDETILCCCYMGETANAWRVALDNMKWPDKPGTHILVTMPDGSSFEVIE